MSSKSAGFTAAIGAADLCQCVWHRAPFGSDRWIFELKHDGFRAFARKSGTGVQLLPRRAIDSRGFPEIVAALRRLHRDVVLDGELVVPDAYGRSDFEEVRRRNLLQRPRMIADAATRRPAVLVVFDLLQINGDDLRSLPLFERRRALHEYIDPRPGIQIIEPVETHGEALFRAIVDGDHEGIVAKRANAPYRAGPNRIGPGSRSKPRMLATRRRGVAEPVAARHVVR